MAAPDKALVSWAIAAAGGHVLRSVARLAESGELGPWLLELDAPAGPRRLVLHAAETESEEYRRLFAVRVLAQAVATRYALPAPEVVAADDGTETGCLAILETALPGSSRIPAMPEAPRLRALGREAARISAVRPSATSGLPRRRRPLEGQHVEDLDGLDASRTLVVRARELVADTTPPTGDGLVHGDLWQGNTLWDRGQYAGAVDWDYAGIGPDGIDLGSLRCDVAMMFGPDAVTEVTTGWEDELGRSPELLPYWDVVSCLAATADLAYWLTTFHAQGRTDLDIGTVTGRRDALLAAAVAELH